MRNLFILIVVLASAACAPATEFEREQREYQRVEYYETVFRPTTDACARAGGYMIYEDTARNSSRHAELSYADMRMAVFRGCSGI